jgi:hypothetical protein
MIIGIDGSVHYVELREEAVKFWEHFESNELVYAHEIVKSLSDAGGIVPSEGYLDGRFWIEVNLVLKGKWDSVYKAIINRLSVDIKEIETSDYSSHGSSMSGNSSMLIQITDLVQPPQRVTFKGVPSMVWLKRFDLTEGCVGNSGKLALESSTPVMVPIGNDGELSAPRRSAEACQCPDGLIQRSTHTVNGISSDEANPGRNVMEFHGDDVFSMFYIVLAGNGIGLRWRGVTEGIKRSLQGAEVFLRPTNLRIGIGHAGFVRHV